jgi:hypothetical protein
MKNLSIWTITLAIAGGLTTGAWTQHGGGEHGVGGPRFDSPGERHSPTTASTRGSGATNFETRLANNTKLAARLQPLLTAAGQTSLQTAATGFKNQGQFIATLHVSQNLNIPFDKLKAEMTGADHDSLGRAIHDLRPDLDPKTVHNDVRLAEHQAKTDTEVSEPSEPKEPTEAAERPETHTK